MITTTLGTLFYCNLAISLQSKKCKKLLSLGANVIPLKISLKTLCCSEK